MRDNRVPMWFRIVPPAVALVGGATMYCAFNIHPAFLLGTVGVFAFGIVAAVAAANRAPL